MFTSVVPIRFCTLAALLGGGLLVVSRSAADELALPGGVVAALKGHTEIVYAIAFSPDGRQVLTGSFDRTLKLWETATGKEIRSFGGLAGHQQNILTVAFSPDGRYLASGSQDNSARLWDNPLSGPQREFAHADEVNSLALNPDGSRLAGAGKDGAIKIWNTGDGKQTFNLTGHSGAVTGVAFGSQQLLASSGSDRTVRLWDATTGKLSATFGSHQSSVNAIQMLGNNSAISAGDDGLVKIWRLTTVPARLLAAHGDTVTAMTISADGQAVITGGADKIVRISNFNNGQQLRQLTGSSAAISAVDYSVTRATVAAGTADGKLFVWSGAEGKLLSQKTDRTGAVAAVALHPQATQLLSAGGTQLKLWDLQPPKKDAKAEDKPLKVLDAHVGGISAVVFHNNGTQALSGGADRLVKLWNLTTGQVLRVYGPLADPVIAIAFSRDYTQVGAAAGKTVKVWNAGDGKQVLTLDHPAAVTSLSFSADRTKIVTGAVDGNVRVWEVASAKELQFFPQSGPVRAVAWHADNKSIVSASTDKAAVVNTLSCSRLIVAGQAPIRAMALTPSGTHVVTASDDKTVKLWNLGNGLVERTFAGAEGPVTAVAVARNGVLLAAGGADRTVRVYSFADAKQQLVLKTPGAVRSLAFSSNNQNLAAACADRTVVTWNTAYNPGPTGQMEFGKPGQSFAHAAAATAVAFLPNSVELYSTSADKTIKAWKLAADQPIKNYAHPNFVDAVAFNPTGTQLATGCHDGTVRIWDVAKGQPVRQINAHIAPPAPAPVYCVAWSPDGKQVISGSLDRSLKLWDATTGALVREFKAYKQKDFEKGHRDGVFCVAFSPDGKFIASGSSDHTIKIWSVANGTIVRELVNPNIKTPEGVAAGLIPPQAHPGWVNGLRFTPDGAYLVSAGEAPRFHGYLAVWRVADGKMLFAEEAAVGKYHALAMSPDGRLLALACGPRGSQSTDVPCYVIKMPEVDKRQAVQAGK